MFGRFGASDGNPNPLHYFYSLGFGSSGLIASRPFDRFGIGYYYIDIESPTFQGPLGTPGVPAGRVGLRGLLQRRPHALAAADARSPGDRPESEAPARQPARARARRHGGRARCPPADRLLGRENGFPTLSRATATERATPWAMPRWSPARTATYCSACPTLAPGASARCPRCDKELWRRREDSLDRTLALTLAAAVLYVVANSVPMLGLTAVGREASTTVARRRAAALEGRARARRRCWSSSPPSSRRRCRSASCSRSCSGPGASARRAGSATLLRHHPTTRTWSMIEVMMLGVLVALIKIADYATVIPGLALFALGALDLPARRDPGELRPAGGVGARRVGGGRRATRAIAEADCRGDVVSALTRPPCSTACRAARPAACSRARRPARTKDAARAATRSSSSASRTACSAPGRS